MKLKKMLFHFFVFLCDLIYRSCIAASLPESYEVVQEVSFIRQRDYNLAKCFSSDF